MGIGGRAADPQATPIVPAHLYRRSQVWELFLSGEKSDLESWVDLKRFSLVDGAHPAICSAALSHHWKCRHVGVVDPDFRRFTLRDFPDALVAIGNTLVKAFHGGEKVQEPVRLFASTGVIKGVQWAISSEEVAIFIEDELSHRLRQCLRFRVKDLLEQVLTEKSVTFVVEMDTIDGEVDIQRSHRFGRRSENVDKADFLIFGDRLHSSGIHREASVVEIRCRD